MTEHILKTVEPYFSAVKSGEKTFEARRNDRGFQKGDVLVLLDPEQESHFRCGPSCKDREVGAIRKVVSFVFSGDPALRDLGGLVPGYVVLALAEQEPASSLPDRSPE